MDTEATSTTRDIAGGGPPNEEVQGSVLAVLAALLGDHKERDTVLEIVGKLVSENEQMSRRIARLASRFNTTASR